MNLTKSITQKPQSQKPERHLRPLPVNGDYREFEIYSLTRAGHEHEHMVCIGTKDESVHCTCEHFTHRFARTWPGIADTACHCKHITRALNYLKRHKELPAQTSLTQAAPVAEKACVSCPCKTAEHGLADDNGHAIEGEFICSDCVRRARMMHPETDEVPVTEPELYAGYDEWLDELEEEYSAEELAREYCDEEENAPDIEDESFFTGADRLCYPGQGLY